MEIVKEYKSCTYTLEEPDFMEAYVLKLLFKKDYGSSVKLELNFDLMMTEEDVTSFFHKISQDTNFAKRVWENFANVKTFDESFVIDIEYVNRVELLHAKGMPFFAAAICAVYVNDNNAETTFDALINDVDVPIVMNKQTLFTTFESFFILANILGCEKVIEIYKSDYIRDIERQQEITDTIVKIKSSFDTKLFDTETINSLMLYLKHIPDDLPIEHKRVIISAFKYLDMEKLRKNLKENNNLEAMMLHDNHLVVILEERGFPHLDRACHDNILNDFVFSFFDKEIVYQAVSAIKNSDIDFSKPNIFFAQVLCVCMYIKEAEENESDCNVSLIFDIYDLL